MNHFTVILLITRFSWRFFSFIHSRELCAPIVPIWLSWQMQQFWIENDLMRFPFRLKRSAIRSTRPLESIFTSQIDKSCNGFALDYYELKVMSPYK